MDNIQNYLEKFANISLDEIPFNKVDSLVLCNISYQIFDDYVPKLHKHRWNNSEPIALKTLVDDEYILTKMIDPTLDTPRNKVFLHTFVDSKRFEDFKINYFYSIFDEEEETQFAAMVFMFHGINYIAFRGTDASILGWKEDFNMALLDVIPSQGYAVAYLNKVIPLLNGQIIVGGHSKGGNLARYASTYCKHNVQNQISIVYDHDGPGMQNDLSNDECFLRIKDRIDKTVPHDSIVGILMKHDYNFKVVKCKSIFIAQHNPYSWGVDLDTADFIYLDENTYISQINDLAINKWIDELSMNERDVIIECVFKLFRKANIITVRDVVKYPLTALYRILLTMREFTKKEKETCFKAIIELTKAWLMTAKAKPPKIKKKATKNTSK